MITNVPNWQTKTPQEILDYLNESVWVPSTTVVTLAVLRERLGLEAYVLVRQTMESATTPADNTIEAKAVAIDIQDALAAMQVTGISLSSSDRQQAVDLLASKGKWPDELRDAVKALGGIYQPRWQQYGEKPTLKSVTEEQNELFKQELLVRIRIRLDVAFNQIGTTEQSQAITELRSIADELEA